MAWSSTDLDLLESAIATAAIEGYAEVQFSDRTMRRYSIDELLRLRAVMKTAVTSGSATVRTTYAQHSRD